MIKFLTLSYSYHQYWNKPLKLLHSAYIQIVPQVKKSTPFEGYVRVWISPYSFPFSVPSHYCLFFPFSTVSNYLWASGMKTLQISDLSLPQQGSCRADIKVWEMMLDQCVPQTLTQSWRLHSQRNSTRYLYSGFSNGYCLLLHCFMDGNLIPQVHFVKFINATYTLQQKNKK